jgi:hypothetical protein
VPDQLLCREHHDGGMAAAQAQISAGRMCQACFHDQMPCSAFRHFLWSCYKQYSDIPQAASEQAPLLHLEFLAFPSYLHGAYAWQ